ncbi:MAG: arginase family protein [archaeon]|jgi:arginase family enzyme
MKNKYFGVATDEGALEKNDGCKKAPNFLLKLFKVKGVLFDLNDDLDEVHQQIYAQANQVFCNINLEKEKPVFFGGTHDVTGFIVKAFAKKYANAKLLIFDAHADCEDALPSITTHEDFVRLLVEKNILKGEDIFIFGLRKVSDIEKECLAENKINHIYFDEINNDFEKAKKQVLNFVKGAKNLYVSFDVDMLNSEIMKATGYYPDDGLSCDQTKELLELSLPNACAIDLVEFNPDKISLGEDKLIFELFKKFFK